MKSDKENRRLFVMKREPFRLKGDLVAFSEIAPSIKGVTTAVIYDIFSITPSLYVRLRDEILVDSVTDESFEIFPDSSSPSFAVEYLPGQFDARAHSAMSCLSLITGGRSDGDVFIRSGSLYLFEGDFTRADLEALKGYVINPVEAREKNLSALSEEDHREPQRVRVFEEFCAEGGDDGVFDTDDRRVVAEYFDKRGRKPTETEIKVLEAYWSDHCRHRTFHTKLRSVTFPEGAFGEALRRIFEECRLLSSKEGMTLMEIATVYAKSAIKRGLFSDVDVSKEINAASLKATIAVDGRSEEWLVVFKNETHNHPTEIEPVGGAETCLGGVIRDPLSGRGYVYQALRLTGAADPLLPLSETLPGKLPQRKICRSSAAGFSAYGNRIGLPTTLVSELYHPGFMAKRFEAGVAVGAVKREWVRREEPLPGDCVLLIGGGTGRDGVGGAAGSSAGHNENSLVDSGAEVQKGNPVMERKLLRLFRREEALHLIKRCNDFGAGGVAVAVGEIADGIRINLDAIHVKRQGLNGTELAISESQERMAVLVSPEDVLAMTTLAKEEDLIASMVATVTETPEMVMVWRGEEILKIDRAFLDSGGGEREADVVIPSLGEAALPFIVLEGNSLREKWFGNLARIEVASHEGLAEMFDSTIGSATALLPFGGRRSLTPIQSSVVRIPVEGETKSASVVTWGGNPHVASSSPYHGAIYSVLNSLAKVCAAGADPFTARLSFQEYFPPTKDAVAWGAPLAALLGAFEAQRRLGIPAIGGKDSMSGAFKDLEVPPLLVSFAVSVMSTDELLTGALKEPGSHLYLFHGGDPVDYDRVRQNFTLVKKLSQEGKLLSAYAVDEGGVAGATSLMAFGGGVGIAFDCESDILFRRLYAGVVIEVSDELSADCGGIRIGEVTAQKVFRFSEDAIPMSEAEEVWRRALRGVYPVDEESISYTEYPMGSLASISKQGKRGKPTVFIPVFPGVNCEYDTARSFLKNGANITTTVFKGDIDPASSLSEMAEAIGKAQILTLAGGFSASDEPDGSGKYIGAFLKNPRIWDAVMSLLERGGLILGICNGFQALVRGGLLPGEGLQATLAHNRIERHISKMVSIRVINNESPWLCGFEKGAEFSIPVSHGEGRFYASEKVIRTLYGQGRIATEYGTDINGSLNRIEGITSSDGRIYGRMGHPERVVNGLYRNFPHPHGMDIFSNAVRYFA